MKKRRKRPSKKEFAAIYAKLGNNSNSSTRKISGTGVKRNDVISVNKSTSFHEERLRLSNFMKKPTFPTEIKKQIGSKIPYTTLLKLALAVAAVGTGNVWIIVTYKAFVMANYAYKISQILEKSRVKEQIEKMLLREGLSTSATKITSEKTDEISREITYAFCSTGIIDTLSKNTQIPKDSVDMIFSNTFKNAFESGIGNLANFVVDKSW